MKMKKAIAIFACAAMLAGCGGTSTSSSGSSEDLSSPKFAFIGPLSGAASQYGTAVKNALELGIKNYNEANGTNITAVYYDDQSDATKAVDAYNKAVDDDKVTAILSPVTTAPCISVAAASQTNGTPILTPSGSGDKITMNGDEAYSNVFRICTNDSYAGTYLAQLCKSQFGYSKVATIYNKDLDYSQGLFDAFEAESKNQNVEVVYSDAYNDNTKDFSTFVSQIKSSGCDAIYLPDYYETVVQIVKQIRDAGIDLPIFGGDGWDGVLGVEGVDADNFEGTYYVSGFDKDATSGAAKEFIDAYKEEYDATPNMFAAMEYDGLKVMMQAINEAGSLDSTKICEALANINFSSDDACCGGFTYDEYHNPVKEMVIVTVKDGEYVTVEKK